LKNTIKPKNVEDITKLLAGLKKLSKADPSLEVLNINGDIVLGTCGEVHLQR
jgi:translation elongation factor EF-G